MIRGVTGVIQQVYEVDAERTSPTCAFLPSNATTLRSEGVLVLHGQIFSQIYLMFSITTACVDCLTHLHRCGASWYTVSTTMAASQIPSTLL